ncbi:hypothetical protein DL769_006801 [Monosporascus sp. CRB-8-3]|nr:hypothetical protein DL769_006801 [Monosporascus sp. CRB-8-3]
MIEVCRVQMKEFGVLTAMRLRRKSGSASGVKRGFGPVFGPQPQATPPQPPHLCDITQGCIFEHQVPFPWHSESNPIANMDSAVPIYSRVNESGTVFISLERALRNSSRFAAQVRPEDIKDEFDRFKIWAGNIAAHRKGRRSLEYRLRDAALLKDEAHNLLTALHDSLQTSLSIVQEERRPWDELSDSESDSDSDTELSDDAETQGDTELKQLLGSIKTTITCLFRLSMSIRDPAPNDQSRSIITVDKSYFEEYDMQHAKAKYPGCAGYLVERLGRANSGRRQYLSYREEHHQKLAKDVDLIGLEASRTEHTGNSTEATTMPKARLNSFDVLDNDDALSQTSYATSVNAAIRVPPLPKEARETEHYECPICFMIVSIHTACIEGCEKTFSLEKDFDRHVQMFHPDLGQPGMLSALKRTAAKRASLSDDAHCPLCGQRMTLRLLQRHVARHQEQLALFALPLNLEATEDDPQDEEQEVYMGGWQDEELSDVSDTLDTNESAGEEQVPVGGSSPEALQDPFYKLDAIILEFNDNLAPECEKFINRPSRGQVECDYLCKKLSQMMLQVVSLNIRDTGLLRCKFAVLRRRVLISRMDMLLGKLNDVLPTELKDDDFEKAGATGVEPSPMSKDLYKAHRPPRSGADAESNRVTLASPNSMAAETQNDKDTLTLPIKGILRKPTEKFPENLNPDRVSVAPLGHNEDIPPGARWTKIDRKLVNPEALEEARERFEERSDYVVVLRVLSPDEIQKLADRTKEIRESRGELTQVPAPFGSAASEAAKRDWETTSSKGSYYLMDISGSEEENRRFAQVTEMKGKELPIRRAAQDAGAHRLRRDIEEVLPNEEEESGRFNKRDTTHMSLIEGGISSKGSFMVAKRRLVSDPGDSEENQPDSRHGRG